MLSPEIAIRIGKSLSDLWMELVLENEKSNPDLDDGKAAEVSEFVFWLSLNYPQGGLMYKTFMETES